VKCIYGADDQGRAVKKIVRSRCCCERESIHLQLLEWIPGIWILYGSQCCYAGAVISAAGEPRVIGHGCARLAQAQKYAKVVDGKECVLRVNPEIAHELQSTETRYLEEIEEILGRPVLVISDNMLHQEKFDLT
jgi:hypothetical protein